MNLDKENQLLIDIKFCDLNRILYRSYHIIFIMYQPSFDWSKLDSIDIGTLKVNPSLYVEYLMRKHMWKEFFDCVSSQKDNTVVLDCVKGKRFVEQALSEMDVDQILMFLTLCKYDSRGVFLRKVRKYCDQNPKISAFAEKAFLNPSEFPWVTENTPGLVCLLPEKTMKALLCGRVPSKKLEADNTGYLFYRFLIKPEYHFSNLTETSIATEGVRFFSYSNFGHKKIKRDSFFRMLFETISDVLAHVQTIDYKKSGLIQAVINSSMNILVESFDNWFYKEELKSIISPILTAFPYHMVFRNEMHQLFTQKIENAFPNQGFPLSFFITRLIIPMKSFVEKCFIPTVIDEIDNVPGHQSPIRDVVKSDFFNNYSVITRLYEFRTIFNNKADTPLARIWPFFVNQCEALASDDVLNKGQSTIFQVAARFLHEKPILGDTKGRVLPLSYDDYLFIVNGVINSVFSNKEKLTSADVKKYPKSLCYILMVLFTGGKFNNSTEDALYDQVYLNNIETKNTAFMALPADLRDKLIIEAIRHPQNPVDFATWITQRPVTVLLGMILKFSSVSCIKLLLPEEGRSHFDQYGFMAESPITYPPLYVEAHKKPTESIETMSLFELFLVKTNFWESKDNHIFQSSFNTYEVFTKLVLHEAIMKNDIELMKLASRVHYRLCRFLLSNTKQVNTKYQLKKLSEIVFHPYSLHVGGMVNPNYAEWIYNDVVKYIPFDGPYLPLAHVELFGKLLTRSHSPLLNKLDEVSSSIAKLLLPNIWQKIPIDHSGSFPLSTTSLLSLPGLNPLEQSVLRKRILNAIANIPSPIECQLFNYDCLAERQGLLVTTTLNESQRPMIINSKVIGNDYEDYFKDPKVVPGGITFINVLSFIDDKIKEYKPEFYEKSSNKFLNQLIGVIKNSEYQTNLWYCEVESPQLPLETGFLRSYSLSKYQSVLGMCNYSIYCSSSTLQILKLLLPKDSSAYTIVSNENCSSVVEKIKTMFTFVALSEEDVRKGKKKEEQDFKGCPVSVNIFRRSEMITRLFEEINVANRFDTDFISLYNEIDNHRLQLFEELQVLKILPKFVGSEQFPSLLTEKYTSAPCEKPKRVIRKVPKLQTSNRDDWAANFTNKLFESVLSLDSESLVHSMSQDPMNLYDIIQIMQTKTTGAKLYEQDYSLDFFSRVLGLMFNDLIGLKQNIKSIFAPKEKGSISINQKYQKTCQVITYISQIVSAFGVGARRLNPEHFLKPLEVLCQISEKQILESMGTSVFQECSRAFIEMMFRIINWGAELVPHNWAKKLHPLFSTFFGMFKSYFFKSAASTSIHSYLKEISDSHSRHVVLSYFISVILSSKITMFDECQVAVVSETMSRSLLGYPLPEFSIKFIIELAKSSSPTADVRRAVIASIIAYFEYQSAFGLEPKHQEQLFNAMKDAHKPMAGDLSVFIFFMINEAIVVQKIEENPLFKDLAHPSLRPINFVADHFRPTITIPKEGIWKEFYESIVSEFVCSALVMKKQHIVELTIIVLSSADLGGHLPSKIAPFITKGLKEFVPSEDNKVFISFALGFCAKFSNQQYTDMIDTFVGIFERIKEHFNQLAIDSLRDVFKEETKLNSIPKALLKSSDELYSVLYSVLSDEISSYFKDTLKQLTQENRNDIISTSKLARRILSVIKSSSHPILRPEFYEKWINTLQIVSDNNFAKAFENENRADTISNLLIFLANNYIVIEKANSDFIEIIFTYLDGDFEERHVKEISQWDNSVSTSEFVIGLLQDKIVKKLPRGEQTPELLSIYSGLTNFLWDESEEVAPSYDYNNYFGQESIGYGYSASNALNKKCVRRMEQRAFAPPQQPMMCQAIMPQQQAMMQNSREICNYAQDQFMDMLEVQTNPRMVERCLSCSEDLDQNGYSDEEYDGFDGSANENEEGNVLYEEQEQLNDEDQIDDEEVEQKVTKKSADIYQFFNDFSKK